MSKLDIQQRVLEQCGVSHEESNMALTMHPSIYERIGKEEGFRKLSELFYDRVFHENDAWFRGIFASSTKAEAIENQYLFFVQTFGGPPLYSLKKNSKYTRLVGRHAAYSISTRAADRWVEHMKHAMEDHQLLTNDIQCKDALYKYFVYTAHYIVIASEYMRPDQLSGGTTVDPGRVW